MSGGDVTYIHIRRLTVVIAVGLGLAIVHFADPFPFWRYPFSYLGRTVSEAGAANLTGQIAYTATMLTGGVVMLGCRRSFRTATEVPPARAGELHGRAVTVAGHLLLQGAVLPYAAWYLVAPPAPGVQKAAVAALILVLLVASYLTRHAPAAAEAMLADAAVADAGVEAV